MIHQHRIAPAVPEVKGRAVGVADAVQLPPQQCLDLFERLVIESTDQSAEVGLGRQHVKGALPIDIAHADNALLAGAQQLAGDGVDGRDGVTDSAQHIGGQVGQRTVAALAADSHVKAAGAGHVGAVLDADGAHR